MLTSIHIEMKLLKESSNQYNITTWDYDGSVEKMKSLILNWRNISIEILDELYFARKVLSSQGVRNDLTNNNLGWSHYLKEVGLNKTTVNRWLRSYDPNKKTIVNPNDRKVDSVILPEELEGTINSKLKTEHHCPHCGYEW